jgi:cell division protein FtsN
MIQVGAFREQIDAEIFNGIEPIYAERTKAGFTRYCVGMFTTYAKAEAALAVLQKRGFVDSFIVGYKEGTRVPVQTIEK